jgi:fermentation-respiration switch protein FrsA (DUF1100 family)
LACLLWWTQDSLVFVPSREYRGLPEQQGLSHDDVDIEVEPGIHIRGWFVPAQGPSSGTVLYFHGNGGNLSNYLSRIAPFAAAGLDTLAIDYEGYGASGGTPSEANLYRDADAAWAWLTKIKGVEAGHIVVWGYSLGGGVATWCATKHTPGAVILESTFTSIPDVGARVYPWLPVRLIAHTEFANSSRVAAIHSPVLFGHGKRDVLIPFEMSVELHRLAREPKGFVEMAGGHDDSLVRHAETWSSVKKFLEDAGFAGLH